MKTLNPTSVEERHLKMFGEIREFLETDNSSHAMRRIIEIAHGALSRKPAEWVAVKDTATGELHCVLKANAYPELRLSTNETIEPVNVSLKGGG